MYMLGVELPEVNFSSDPQDLGYGHVWLFNSKTRPGLFHVTILVNGQDGNWWCSCEGYRYTNACRHIRELKELTGCEDEPDDGFQINL
jgi:hypothetical protein